MSDDLGVYGFLLVIMGTMWASGFWFGTLWRNHRLRRLQTMLEIERLLNRPALDERGVSLARAAAAGWRGGR